MDGKKYIGMDVHKESISIEWAAMQEKLRPAELCFFLTSLYRTYQELSKSWEQLAGGDKRIYQQLYGKLASVVGGILDLGVLMASGRSRAQ